jgi:hypothetical protein
MKYKIRRITVEKSMESRNIILAVMSIAIAFGVLYMIDPTLGGLLPQRREGFENNGPTNIPASNNSSNVVNYSGANSVTGEETNMFTNGENEYNEVMSNPNVNANQHNVSESTPSPIPSVSNNIGQNITEGFENHNPSPMPFSSAEKPANCYPKNQLAPQELLPNDPNSKWAQVNPMGAGDISGKNFLNAGALIGVNTIGSSLRNASWDLRSTPPNPQVQVSPWMQTTIEPDLLRRPLEIG